MLTRLAGGLMLFAATSVQLQPLSVLVDVLGIVGLVGTVGVGLSALYRARSGKRLDDMQSMRLLFEQQKEINTDALEQREAEIEQLRQQIARANGDRDKLERRLRRCMTERTVLRNQIEGLELTLAELRRKTGSD